MSKCISSIHLTENLVLNECTDGFWLYDKTRGMNLSMKAKSPQEAFVECITYYQKRLTTVEKQFLELSSKVDSFVAQFIEEGDY